MHSIKTKDTKNNWRIKAVERNKIIHRQKKRITELTKSRDVWKSKYTAFQCKLKAEVIKQDPDIFNKNGKPENYKYPSLLISLCMNIMSYSGSSLRSCKHFLTQLFIIFEINTCVPCHSTIRMWVCKTGYYNYHAEKDNDSEWVLIIDESVNLGASKAFVVLGINLNIWVFGKPIVQSDVELLFFEVVTESKKEYVRTVLEDLKKKYKIKYTVSDKGNNLLGAYGLIDFVHIPDCTHVLAKALEKYFKKDTIASEFLSMSGKLRQKWNMGKKTVYMPPAQRKKARFQNLSPLIKWGNKIQNIWTKIPDEIKKELSWIEINKKNFEELKIIDKFIDFISKELKTTGYSAKTANLIEQYISTLPALSACGDIFIAEVRTYLSEIKEKSDNLGECLICCSDIIESLFGKLKYSVNTNSPFGMTEFSFALASIGNNNSAEHIKIAMENTTEKKIKAWKKKNIAPSLFQKKKALFSMKNEGKK